MAPNDTRQRDAGRVSALLRRWFGGTPTSDHARPPETSHSQTASPPAQCIEVDTSAGILKLVPATEALLKAFAVRWPMGMGMGSTGDLSYLCFQIGEQEAYGVKLQPPDTDERNGKLQHLCNLALIAAAYPRYLELAHRGLMLPCAYLREKGNDRFESGFAFFVAPDPMSAPDPSNGTDTMFDGTLGDGATRMILDFIDALREASQRLELELGPFIGVDLRPRLALGRLGLSFMICGRKVLAVQHPLHKEYPFWKLPVQSGVTELPYAPMVPTALPGDTGLPHGWTERMKIVSERLRAYNAQKQSPGPG